MSFPCCFGSSFPRGGLLTDEGTGVYMFPLEWLISTYFPTSTSKMSRSGWFILFSATCLDFRPVWRVATETLCPVQKRACLNQLLKADESLLGHPTSRLSLCVEESAHSSNEEMMLLRTGDSWWQEPLVHPERAAMEVGGRDKFFERSAVHQDTNMMDTRVFPILTRATGWTLLALLRLCALQDSSCSLLAVSSPARLLFSCLFLQWTTKFC